MHAIHSLIVDLTLITIYAGITTLLCKKFKQPIVLGYVLAGIFAGPYFDLLPTVRDKEDLTLWADIGVIFLLFGLGLEFSFKKKKTVKKRKKIPHFRRHFGYLQTDHQSAYHDRRRTCSGF